MTEHPLDFDTFARLHPQPHVVVGQVVGDLRGADLTVLHRRLRHLIKSQGIAGDHATGLVRTADETEIQCRFASHEDAVALAACFNARTCDVPGFATSRRFVLDDAEQHRLKAAVTAAPGRSRSAPGDAQATSPGR